MNTCSLIDERNWMIRSFDISSLSRTLLKVEVHQLGFLLGAAGSRC